MRSIITKAIVFIFTTASLFPAVRDVTLSSDVAELIEKVTVAETNEEVSRIVNEWKSKVNLFPITAKGYVNFLYYTDSTKDVITKVAITGDFNKNSKTEYLKRVGKTNLFYKTKKIKNAD
ncbi:MAG TPA: hypothetical protein PK899_12780, partial [Spirochaetota bacterium]|nr:hypothetical protein [Spirochaetota bacterium]